MQHLENNGDNENLPTDDIEKYLTFLLGNKTYGLDIINIKEIVEYGEVTEVPMTPEFISGVINLRGSVVPVIDINHRFSGQPIKITKRTSLIIIEVSNDELNLEIGILVDIVNEVVDIRTSEIESAPELGRHIQTNFISGMAKIDDKFLILLDIENILSIDELSMVCDIQSAAKH